MRTWLAILPFALLVVTSCDIFKPSSDGHDIERFTAGGDEYFRAFPRHAEDVYFIQEGFQGAREHVTFFASRGDVDRFIQENLRGMIIDEGAKPEHAPRPEDEHWPKRYDHITRSYLYKYPAPGGPPYLGSSPFWLGIFVQDEPRGSRLWAYSDLGG